VIVVVDGTDVVHVEVGQTGPVGPVGPVGPPANQFRGVVYRTQSGTIDFAGVTPGDFIESGLTGTLDSSTSIDTVAANAGIFGVKRTGEGTQPCYAVATADVSAGSPKLLAVKLAVNGTPIDATECNASVTNQTVAKLHTMFLLELEEDDVVSVFFANYTSSSTITVARARMVVFGVP